jgi:hypothetical protein
MALLWAVRRDVSEYVDVIPFLKAVTIHLEHHPRASHREIILTVARKHAAWVTGIDPGANSI